MDYGSLPVAKFIGGGKGGGMRLQPYLKNAPLDEIFIIEIFSVQ